MALSTTLENPIPIINITSKDNEEKKTIHFEIDSPPEKANTNEYPSLKSLIEGMCFTEKTPHYKACVKSIEAISPKRKINSKNVVDLTSPTEVEEKNKNNNDILFVEEKESEQEEKAKITRTLQQDEEHEEVNKQMNQKCRKISPKGTLKLNL